MKLKINDLRLLDLCECSGNEVRIRVQLDRKDYTALNKILEGMGGLWNRCAKVHLFPCDSQSLIDVAINAGEVRTASDFLKETNFFETPEPMARRMVAAADFRPGALVLEPSAGRGALAKIITAGQGVCSCVERVPKFVAELDALGFAVIEADFLTLTPTGKFDAVVMNPPFSGGRDVQHVRHAFGFLKPGASLVSIMGAGVLFRESKIYREFREWSERVGGSIEALPEGSFKDSGTGVNAVIFTVTRKG